MDTSIAAATARRAATLARISPSATRAAASLIPRRGLAGAAERHAPPKVPIWNWRVPLMNRKLAFSLFLMPVMAIHVVIFDYALPSRGKDEKEMVEEPAK